MPRFARYVPPKSRDRVQASRQAREFANGLRVLDAGNSDFTITQDGQEVVVSRFIKSPRYPAIADIFSLVAKQIAKSGTLEDVHMHYDGDTLSMYFTETSIYPHRR